MAFFWQAGTNGYHGSSISPGTVPGPSRGILHRLRQITSGWLGPRLSHEQPPGDELVREKAAGGPRGIFDLPWFLPYFDNYTDETQEMRRAYRKMWSDPHVKSACAGKIFSVAALDLRFQPASKSDPTALLHKEFADYVFNERLRGGFPELAWNLLFSALTDGYAVLARVWGAEDRGRWSGNWILRDLKPIDTGTDLVLQTDEFRNITGLMGLRYNAGIEFAPADFLIFRHMPIYNQPVGLSDFRAAYASWWMLDTAKKLRMIGAEKRAYPTIIGQWANAAQQPGLEGILAKIKFQNWLSVPEQIKLTVLDMAGKGDEVFATLTKDLKHDIYIGISYAVLQSLEGAVSDAHGNSQVHKEVTELAQWYLSECILSSVFNDRETGLVKDLIDLNYLATEYPKAKLSAIDPGELATEAQIDQILHSIVPLSATEIYERYNRTPPTGPDDLIPPVGGQQQAGVSPSAPPAPPFGEAGMGGPVNALTAQPKKHFLHIESNAPLTFSEAWQRYLNE